MRQLRLAVAIVTAFAARTPLGAQVQTGPDVQQIMVNEFERSYITFGDAINHKKSLLFEGSIAPPFFVTLPSIKSAVVVTPKIVVRMFDLHSSPVRTPSYMPRITWYWFGLFGPVVRTDNRRNHYVSLTLSHHSNGQEGPELDSLGAVNHLNGNFSTNFLELAYAGGLEESKGSPLGNLARLAFGRTRYSIERHFPGVSAAHADQFPKTRLHFSRTFQKTWSGKTPCQLPSFKGCFDNHYAGFNLTYLAGNVAEKFKGVARWPLSIHAGLTPKGSRDLSIYLEYYTGQDYYNMYFDQAINAVRIGLRANRGLAR